MRGTPGQIALVRRSFPDRPAFGTAVSRAILTRVAKGELPPTLRLHRPAPILAFGRMDRLAPGYRDAVRAARAAGFTPVERLAGGRAAVFHEGTLSFSIATPDPNPPRRTRQRFEHVAGAVATALRRLGVEARVGEVPGEYCPGAWSVNARGTTKLAGIGQRMISGGAHVGGVLVVRGSRRVRDVLVPVYEALDLEWDPETTGSVEDELADPPTAGPQDDRLLDAASDALLAALPDGAELVDAELDPETLALAADLEAGHTAPST